jgi:hypothetical protein
MRKIGLDLSAKRIEKVIQRENYYGCNILRNNPIIIRSFSSQTNPGTVDNTETKQSTYDYITKITM